MTDSEADIGDDLAARRAERHAEEQRAVQEAGGGESEGFEAAEEALIENASHGDQHTTARILRDAGDLDEETEEVAGEADQEHQPDT